MVSDNEIKKIQKIVELDLVNMGDIEEIYKIEESSFKSPWEKKFFYFLLHEKDSMFVKLIYDKKIVGYFILLFEYMQYTKIAHLINLAVHPDYRKNGFGKFLIYAVEKIAINQECKIIKLEVRISNKPAINLYKKSGFEISRILDKYYQNEDGLLMEKYIY